MISPDNPSRCKTELIASSDPQGRFFFLLLFFASALSHHSHFPESSAGQVFLLTAPLFRLKTSSPFSRVPPSPGLTSQHRCRGTFSLRPGPDPEGQPAALLGLMSVRYVTETKSYPSLFLARGFFLSILTVCISKKKKRKKNECSSFWIRVAGNYVARPDAVRLLRCSKMCTSPRSESHGRMYLDNRATAE